MSCRTDDSTQSMQTGHKPGRTDRRTGMKKARIRGVMHPRMKQRPGIKTHGRDRRAGRKAGKRY